MTLRVGSSIGKYSVRQKLAEGGMAEIFLCAQRGPEGFAKDVVIKRVRPFLASDPAFVEMFIAEARLASRLDHRNVVQIFDFDRHEDTYYLAMEYVRGASLWELRRRCREQCVAFPPVLAAHIGAEVARGLAYAHRLSHRGQPLHVVHRDVTPHNILLSFEGAVKLTDFGIARAGNSATAPGMLKGKFAYMSPEQARGEQVDARTDIFALGIVLWELLTGGRLFDGDTDVSILRAVQTATIVPPARLNPDVPPELDAIVMRALDRDVEARFPSAAELERALSQVVLQCAKSVDDTDVGAFLRRLCPEPATQVTPLPVELSTLEEGETPAPGTGAPPQPREPTAVMPGRQGRVTPRATPARTQTPPLGQRALSPDEDGEANTWLIQKRSSEDAGMAAPAVPPSPAPPEPAMAAVVPAPAQAAAGPGTAMPAVEAGKAPVPVEVARLRGRGRVALAAGGAVLALLAGVALLRGGGAQPAEGTTVAPTSTAVVPAKELQAPPAPAAGERQDAVAAVAVTAQVEPPTASSDAGAVAEAPASIAPPPGAASTASAPAVVEAPVTPQGHRPARAEARGVLVLHVAPWAHVTIDGRTYRDVSGRRSFKLSPGVHRVAFEHSKRSEEHQVAVVANQEHELRFNGLAK